MKISEDQFEYKKLEDVRDSIKIEYNPINNQLILSYILPYQKIENDQIKCKHVTITIIDWINLNELDDFSENRYLRLLAEKNILLKKKPSKSACIRTMVSENRLRYNDEDFNLDLTYITPRVIAMGFPSSGIR